MKYLYIGQNHERLYLDRDTLKVYRIQEILLRARSENDLSGCDRQFIKKDNLLGYAGLIMCALLPVVYKNTQSLVLLLAMILLSAVFFLSFFFARLERTERKICQFIERFPEAIVTDDVISIFKEHAFKKLIACIAYCSIINFGFLYSVYSFFTEGDLSYSIIILFNVPTFSLLIFLAVRPITTLIYYFKYKHNME